MDFIYRKHNFFSPELCADFINTFESSSLHKRGCIVGKGNEAIEIDFIKQSTDITFWPDFLDDENNRELIGRNKRKPTPSPEVVSYKPLTGWGLV